MDFFIFTVYCLAAFRVTKFLLDDYLFDPIRNFLWSKFPPEKTKIGYLLSCPWCLSFWVSTALLIGYILIPSVMFIICLVLALSAVVGIISTLLDRN